MDKKYYQIASRIRVAHSCIHILILPITGFYKAKFWPVEKNFFRLFLRDAVFTVQLFYDCREPNKIIDVHNPILYRHLQYMRQL